MRDWMAQLSYWWQAGPGPYVARLFKGLLIGIVVVIGLAVVFALVSASFDLSLAAAEVVATRIHAKPVDVWFSGLFALAIIVGVTIWQFLTHPIERRKKAEHDSRYGAEYDPYERSQVDTGSEGNVQRTPQKTPHSTAAYHQVQINTKNSKQEIR